MLLAQAMTSGRPHPKHWGFARRLRQARRAAKLTAAGLSQAAGMSRGAVGLMEAEHGLPLLSTAERLAHALHCSAGWLCYGLDSPWEAAPELRCTGLAARVRQVRLEQDLSLAEVGRRAGSSAAAIKSLESGTVPTIATAEQAAKALGVSPAWLSFAEGPRELPRRGARRPEAEAAAEAER